MAVLPVVGLTARLGHGRRSGRRCSPARSRAHCALPPDRRSPVPGWRGSIASRPLENDPGDRGPARRARRVVRDPAIDLASVPYALRSRATPAKRRPCGSGCRRRAGGGPRPAGLAHRRAGRAGSGAPCPSRQSARLESAAARERQAAIAAQLPVALDLVVATLEVGPSSSRRPGSCGRGDRGPAWGRARPSSPAALPSLATRSRCGPRCSTTRRSLRSVGRFVAPRPRACRSRRSISGVADELRRERRARRRDDSRKVAVRTAAPLGACFLPAFFLIGIVPTIMGAFRSFTF